MTQLAFTALLLCPAAGAVAAAPHHAKRVEPRCAPRWVSWQAYSRAFVSEDGRVIDRTGGDRTTSEGQAYAMFFSLVAGDRERFAELRRWTEENLAGGDLTARLPAWHWGRHESGAWRVLDDNSAADADLWLTYTMLEAGRLWDEPDYTRLGLALLSRVAATEVVRVEPVGALLLPGARGFELRAGKTWRLNPSYAPVQLLRRLAVVDREGPWERVLAGSVAMLEQTTPHGLAGDWVVYDREAGFGVDPVTGPVGSYDAIRTYLWAGMLDQGEPHRASLLRALGGMHRYWERHDRVPEKVNTQSGRESRREGPVGFFAALLPWAVTAEAAAADRLLLRVVMSRDGDLHGEPPSYYDETLILFGQGFAEGRYRFDASGALKPSWERACRVR